MPVTPQLITRTEDGLELSTLFWRLAVPMRCVSTAAIGGGFVDCSWVINAQVPKGYGADSLWNYELGMKSSWFERRLTVNMAAFDIDWSNIQVSGRDPTGSFVFQIPSTLVTAPGAQVIVEGGGPQSTIYWDVGSSATLDTRKSWCICLGTSSVGHVGLASDAT